MAKISILTAENLKADFKNSKEQGVLNWLLEYRKKLLQNKTGNYGDIIPSKAEIAKYLNVSTGTVQNALKYAEDMGFFTSKQCVGTMIANPDDKKQLKMFSKKDKALIEIKKYLYTHKYEKGEIIPGVCALAVELKTSVNTVRLAVFELLQQEILKKEVNKNNTILILNKSIKENINLENTEIKNENLSSILERKIKEYLFENFKVQDKIPSNAQLAKMYNVSIRTINSALKKLNKQKIILTRRGNYGSIYINKSIAGEKSMFMSKPHHHIKKNYAYKWEFVMENIIKHILKNHEAGDKILTMEQFAKTFNVSTATIKRAVRELQSLGILFAQKGKYGGLFILEMPQKEDSYQWLAVNPEYFN